MMTWRAFVRASAIGNVNVAISLDIHLLGREVSFENPFAQPRWMLKPSLVKIEG